MRTRPHGFTLLEVMVALVVVATAFVALLGLQNRNLAWIGQDQDLTRATLLARQLITQMELVEQFPELGTSQGEFDDYPGFYWEREVTETELPDLREVRLRVVWDERSPHACELLYFIRDHREPLT
jgi:general secretion pathway protein I